MRLMSILIAILVSIALYFFVFERSKLTGAPSKENETTESKTEDEFAPPALKTDVVDKIVSVVAIRSQARALENAVIVRGQTQANRQVEASAQTNGQVISEPLRKGAYVKEGQMLCELDPGVRSATLAQARAALAEAEVILNNAKRLSAGGYGAETRVFTAEAAVELARASVAQIESDIAHLKITAPFSGLLETDTAEFGTILQNGAKCATIIQLDPIKLVGFVSETEVDKINVGALATARLISNETVSGRVTFLSRSADVVTRTFRVEAEVPNSDFAIRDGQTVEIGVNSDGQLAHLVPQSALTLNNDGAIGLRIIDQNNLAQFVSVNVIRDTHHGMWVSGLPQDANIITVGQEYVRSGVKLDPHFEGDAQ